MNKYSVCVCGMGRGGGGQGDCIHSKNNQVQEKLWILMLQNKKKFMTKNNIIYLKLFNLLYSKLVRFL